MLRRRECALQDIREGRGDREASDPQDDKAHLSLGSEDGMRNSWVSGPSGSWTASTEAASTLDRDQGSAGRARFDIICPLGC